MEIGVMLYKLHSKRTNKSTQQSQPFLMFIHRQLELLWRGLSSQSQSWDCDWTKYTAATSKNHKTKRLHSTLWL